MAKDEHAELRVILPDSDIEGLRHLAKENQHPDGIQGIALEFIQQGLGRRKLGDYIHLEAHQTVIDGKDTTIAGLKKKAIEAAEMWAGVVISLGMQDDLRETIKNIPAWCLERVAFITKALTAATEKNEEYEEQIAELKETTLLRTEHEERVDTVSKEKQKLQTQLQAETESAKRLNVKLTEQETEIQELKTQTGAQKATIVSLRDRVELTRENEKMWKGLYIQEYEKPFWRKFLDSFLGRPDLPHAATDETPPEEKATELEEIPPKTKPDDDMPF